jgi:hypothetical protein
VSVESLGEPAAGFSRLLDDGEPEARAGQPARAGRPVEPVDSWPMSASSNPGPWSRTASVPSCRAISIPPSRGLHFPRSQVLASAASEDRRPYGPLVSAPKESRSLATRVRRGDSGSFATPDAGLRAVARCGDHLLRARGANGLGNCIGKSEEDLRLLKIMELARPARQITET